MKPPRIALLFVQSGENATLSYQHGWPKAFMESSLFACTPINLAARSLADRLAIARQLHTGRFAAIVLLHSVFSNQQNLRGVLFWALAACRAPKAYFIGNEYKLMPEKMRFCRRLGIALLISQSNDPAVLSLYRKILGCKVDGIPNTGFDTTIFRPRKKLQERPIDIGYRSYEAPWYLGNNEKSEIAEFFQENAGRYGLRADISLDPAMRFNAVGYATFLNDCRGQIGTESGGDYFEVTDDLRLRVYAYTKANKGATWPEIRSRFFCNQRPSIPMRIISGRQVEAAACKTVQILYEGRYSGYFQPDIHYIALKKDYSNITEVIEKLRDDDYCEQITGNAYEVALAELTYDKLVEKFSRSLDEIL